MLNNSITILPYPDYDNVTFTRGPMHINHFYEISKHGVNALRVYQYIRTIQGLRYPGAAENSHKWVKVDNKNLYEWFGVSQPKKWVILDRLSNKDNPYFTKKILEVRKRGVGKLPEARIVLPKKILH
tara:strand:- start:215 stop:595 length:381 start_codon:yes stop_codon:yes gene_type:complete